MTHGTDLDTIAVALNELPTECRYHGQNFEFLGTERYEAGLPRCDSCKAPWRKAQGIAALDRLRAELARINSVPELRRKPHA